MKMAVSCILVGTCCLPLSKVKVKTGQSYIAPTTKRSQTIPALAFTYMREACSHTWRVKVLPQDRGPHVSQWPTAQSRQAPGLREVVISQMHFRPICIRWRAASRNRTRPFQTEFRPPNRWATTTPEDKIKDNDLDILDLSCT